MEKEDELRAAEDPAEREQAELEEAARFAEEEALRQ